MMKRDKSKEDARVRAAVEKALDEMDYTLEVTPWTDFVEVVGKMGGDTVTYRYYDDGLVVER